MFSKVAIVCLVLVATFCYVKCCATDESTKTEGINGMAQDNETHLDQEAIMAMCNETFRTSMGMFSALLRFSIAQSSPMRTMSWNFRSL